jgi:uncharacterized protein (TIGR02569 family)
MPERKVPPPGVLRAFGLHGRPKPAAGGQQRTWAVGDVFLKPVDDVEEAAWAQAVLSRIEATSFRIARPVPSVDGRWVVDGWSAAQRVEGVVATRLDVVLRAGRAFHAALAGVPRPDFLNRRRHRWAVADRVAWGEEAFTPSLPLAARYNALVALREAGGVPGPSDWRVIHGDLSGNVLTAPGQPPAVIDFAPEWRPLAYAEAIVLVDFWLWMSAPFESVTGVVPAARDPGLLARAALFRLVALDLHARMVPDLYGEGEAFDAVAAHIGRLAEMQRG